MSWLSDLIKDIPVSAVLKERLALAEDKFNKITDENGELRERVAELEAEVTDLRARIPAEPKQAPHDLSEKTLEVMVYLFRAQGRNKDVGIIASNVRLERSEAEYHLELLEERGLSEITGGDYVDGHIYWDLTTLGRRYVVENGLNAR